MPKIFLNRINVGIENTSVYIRSTKKFGKSTLFRDVILEKFGDPACGLLVCCGAETAATMLDEVNIAMVENWKDVEELVTWLIEKKGIEHNIKMVAFDTVDELVLLADEKTIKQSNKDTGKVVRSIKAAFGGYTNGEKYSANRVIKPEMTKLRKAGFGVWYIAHTKYKTKKDKTSIDDEGYTQLTSNLSSDYESVFGDIADVVLTGIIEREVKVTEEVDPGGKKKKKRTLTGNECRRLYFRENSDVEAGGRFAENAVPEFMVFEPGQNNAAQFIKIFEEGMEKSKVKYRGKNLQNIEVKVEQETPEEVADTFTAVVTVTDCKKAYVACTDKEIKQGIKTKVTELGGWDACTQEDLNQIINMLS